jgi:A/G-specific adenine glycosylase
MVPSQALLSWYATHRRDLPWRRTRDPYRILVSEIMLQQTRVEAALPYYERFLARFPTLESLAQAPAAEVLLHWSGLGYYRRARQLHRTAAELASAGESFPPTVEGLLELPGVGPYTAAAVASIAFGVPVPVLDGNVERVLARLLGLSEDPRGRSGRARLLAAAGELLDPERPGDSNQALMELGALICTPAAPKCDVCPLAPDCRAYAEGDPQRYPAPRRRRRPSERVRQVAALVERDGCVLLCRRPDSSPLLAGLWELPWAPALASDEAVEAELAARFGGRFRLGELVGEVRHTITYRSLRVEVRRAALEDAGTVGESVEAVWASAEDLTRLALSAQVIKLLACARAPAQRATRRR